MIESAYRTTDLAAECARLRRENAELTARLAKKPLRPWSRSQRVSARGAVGVLSVCLALVAGCLSGWAFANEWVRLGVGLCAFTALCLHTLIATITAHWDWWRGISDEGGYES